MTQQGPGLLRPERIPDIRKRPTKENREHAVPTQSWGDALG